VTPTKKPEAIFRQLRAKAHVANLLCGYRLQDQAHPQDRPWRLNGQLQSHWAFGILHDLESGDVLDGEGLVVSRQV
jgi:hypothetical protein